MTEVALRRRSLRRNGGGAGEVNPYQRAARDGDFAHPLERFDFGKIMQSVSKG